MADYKDMYYQLFNKLTDIIAELTEVQCQMEKCMLIPVQMMQMMESVNKLLIAT